MSMDKISESISVTWTDLDKGYSDVPKPVIDFLSINQIHDFEGQEPGSKCDVKAFVGEAGMELTVRFLRPRAKNGGWKRISLRKDLVEALELEPDSKIRFGLLDGKLSIHKVVEKEMSENPTVLALNGYGYGGLSAAVVPGEMTEAEKVLPSGEPPAGAVAGINFIKQALDGNVDNPRWLFLIGGPGNGKSWISRNIESEYDLLKARIGGDTLASREYRHQVNGAELIILNDATITLEEGRQKSLQQDLLNYASSGSHVVASLNRGAIIEDLYKFGVDDSQWTRDLLHLLLEDGTEREVLPKDLEGVELEKHGFADSCVAYAMEIDGRKIEFAVAFLDKHSLLEANGGPFNLGKAGEFKRLQTPTGKLALSLVEKQRFEGDVSACGNCPAQQKCPFLANAKSLRACEGRMVSGLADILRASEIASGSPYTYREIWSLLSQAILGRWRPAWQTMHPCKWVQGQDSLEELHRQRIHRSLFPRWEDWCRERIDDIPAQSSLDDVDPGLAASGKWASLASDAVQAVRFGTMPYEYVAKRTGRDKECPEAGLKDCISQLDADIDTERFKDRLDCGDDDANVGDAIKASDLRQPGIELVRMLALWHGRPAANDVFNQWIRAHRLNDGMTLREAGMIHDFPLAKGILRLILPPTEILEPGQEPGLHGGADCLLPLYEPRTEPLVYPPDSPVICLNADPNDITVKIESRGDRLMLLLEQVGGANGVKVAELDLDFWTCREAMILSAQPGGFTEKGFGSAPRLERFRAAICASLEARQGILTIAGHRKRGLQFSLNEN